MKKITSSLLLTGSLFAIISFQNINSQCLVTTGPTNDCSYGDAIDDITIDGVTAANAGCSSGSGYSSFVTPVWNLDLGGSYAMTANLGGATYNQGLAIWIDIDNNGQFDAVEQVYASAAAGLTQTGTIVIPAIGVTGVPLPMRVMCVYNQTIPAANACTSGQNTYGETEDYTVILSAPATTSNVAATAILEPLDSDCGDISDEIWVSVTNMTANSEDSVPVQLNLSGIVTGTYYDTIVPLAGSAVANLLMATINTQSGGVLNAELIINLGDDDDSDDTLMVSINITNSTDLAISGSTSVCDGDSTDVVLDNIVTGETYSWFLDGVLMTTGDVFNDGTLTGAAAAQVVAVSDNTCRSNDTLDISIIPLPTASFTDVVNVNIVDFTGTATNYDTIYWDFDDGTTGTGLSTQHTFSQNGTYNVCFYAINQCDTIEFCEDVVVSTLGLYEVEGGKISVYPNPTSDKVEIELVGFEGFNSSWKLYNIEGAELQSGELKVNTGNESVQISLGQYVPGIYIFKLSNANGKLYQFELVRR